MREISRRYVEGSKKYIVPGVNQVDQLTLTDSESVSKIQTEAKTKQIAAFVERRSRKPTGWQIRFVRSLHVRFSYLPPISSTVCHWKLNNVTDSIGLFSASSFLPSNRRPREERAE